MSGARGPSGRNGPHVFVDDLETPTLSDADEHHVVRVLRLRTDDVLTISDGRGRWRPARLAAGHVIEPTGDITVVARPEPPLTIGFALVKGDRPELVVQKATELGVDRVVPFVADRSVVRWDDKRAEHHLERLRRVGREASMQSRRCWLPEVCELTPLARLLEQPGVAAADREGDPVDRSTTTILIGPEGGWSDHERSRLRARVALGSHVLRAETAAMAAATLLTALRADLIGPAAN